MAGVLHKLVLAVGPAFDQFLHRTHIKVTVMEVFFEFAHVPVQEAAVLANTVATNW